MKSAKAFNKIIRQLVHGHGEFIRSSSISEPGSYKFELQVAFVDLLSK